LRKASYASEYAPLTSPAAEIASAVGLVGLERSGLGRERLAPA
jgi:hypothetical protein